MLPSLWYKYIKSGCIRRTLILDQRDPASPLTLLYHLFIRSRGPHLSTKALYQSSLPPKTTDLTEPIKTAMLPIESASRAGPYQWHAGEGVAFARSPVKFAAYERLWVCRGLFAEEKPWSEGRSSGGNYDVSLKCWWLSDGWLPGRKYEYVLKNTIKPSLGWHGSSTQIILKNTKN